MSQTTTPVGRLQLAHPDIGFDTDDAGVALHAALATMFTSLSNHMPSRYTGSITLANGVSTTITHNFNLAIAKLKVLVFESGAQLTDTQTTASYTITQNSINAIDVLNVSGGPKTFQVLILAFRYGIVNADADAGFDPSWDTTNGIVYKKNLYVNGAHNHSISTEYYDVVILGNLTLTANLKVNGNLYVSGQIIANGFKFDCDGNATVLGGASIINPGLNFTIRGNLITAADWTCQNSSSAQPIFSVGGNFAAIDAATNTARNVTIGGNGVSGTVAIPGTILYVGGDLICNALSNNGSRNGTNIAGGVGGTVNVGKDVIAKGLVSVVGGTGDGNGAAGAGGVISIGGNYNGPSAATIITTDAGSAGATGLGAAGGSVTVLGSLRSASTTLATLVSANGSASLVTGNGGVGGSVTVNANAACTISVNGGAGNGAAGAGGDGGAIVIGGDLSGHNLTNETSANGGAAGTNAAGGAGGSITVHGSVIRAGLNLKSLGGTGNGTGNGGSGGSVTVNGSCLQTGINLTGGASVSGTSTAAGGAGGTLAISGDFRGDSSVGILALGGAASGSGTGASGQGGAITINGDLSCESVNTSAGAGLTTTTTGARAGDITIRGRVHIGGSMTLSGGDGITAGRGGNTTINDSANILNYSASGGAANSASTMIGGPSGNLVVIGDLICGSLTLGGGATTGAAATQTGGTYGNSGLPCLDVRGNCLIRTQILIFGGNAKLTTGPTAALGGSGSVNTVAGDVIIGGNFTSKGTTGFNGGSAWNNGGHSPYVRVHGSVYFGVVAIEGGSALNNSGRIGRPSTLLFARGGTIKQLIINWPGGVGIPPLAASVLGVSGNLSIGSWSIPAAIFDITLWLTKTFYHAVGDVSGGFDSPSQISIDVLTDSGGTDTPESVATTGNLIPYVSTTAGTMVIYGKYNGTNTIWRNMALAGLGIIRLENGNGHGSTNNKIRRFTNTTINVASPGMTYADSATLGMSITINETGLYFMSYSDSRAANSSSIGISVSSAQLTTNIVSITAANRIAVNDQPLAIHGFCSALVRLTAGQVVRAHTDGAVDSTSAVSGFMIVQVARQP